MNTTYTEAMALVDALKESLTEEVVGETGVIITPPALYLSDIVESLVENPYIAVAAQNCHEKESGAYTGEWSAPMLASVHSTLPYMRPILFRGNFEPLQRCKDSQLRILRYPINTMPAA